MRLIADVPYGLYEENLLDLYLPENETFDLFVYFHGGYLARGSRKKDDCIFRYLAQNGIAVASVDYRLYPEAKYPDFLEDAAAAAAWLKMNIELCGACDRIFLGGSSAGGYLAQMLCFDPQYLGEMDLKATDFAGFFLDAGQPTCHNAILKERSLDQRRVIVDETAPLFHVGQEESYPPIHLVVSDQDIPGRYQQTLLLEATLRQFGHNPTLEVRQGTHCHYVGATDEKGDSILGQMIQRFIQSVE